MRAIGNSSATRAWPGSLPARTCPARSTFTSTWISLDPAEFPHLAYPEGRLSIQDGLAVVRSAARSGNLVGLTITEFAPADDEGAKDGSRFIDRLCAAASARPDPPNSPLRPAGDMPAPQLTASFSRPPSGGGSWRSSIAAAASALLLVGASSSPAERIVSGDGIVPVTINGAAGTLRIDPAAPGLLLMTPRLYRPRRPQGRRPPRLRGSLMPSATERVIGRTQVTLVDRGRATGKNRVGWTDRPYAEGSDATIGPAGVPEPIVRLRPAPAPARASG